MCPDWLSGPEQASYLGDSQVLFGTFNSPVSPTTHFSLLSGLTLSAEATPPLDFKPRDRLRFLLSVFGFSNGLLERAMLISLPEVGKNHLELLAEGMHREKRKRQFSL